jgi:uncharacterized sulfatase
MTVRKRTAPLVFAALLTLAAGQGTAAELSYHLSAQKIAAESYVVEGKTEDFSRQNGGFIVNASFIVTKDGALVIDSGPSALFGQELKALVEKTGGQPITQVIITHEHPDHYLGNQAFDHDSLGASALTIAGIKARGADYTTNMYRLLGDWMRGTDSVPPTQVISEHQQNFGGHALRFIILRGHTDADLVIFDQTTGVLYAADLVFHNRAPTTPQAEIKDWLAALETLRALPFTTLVPGHGPVVTSAVAIDQTADWLRWLDQILRQSAEEGLSAAEVMELPIPVRFEGLSLARAEFQRSVVHLYPALQHQALGQQNGSATKVE